MLILIFFLTLSVILNLIAYFAIKKLFVAQDALKTVVTRYDAFYLEMHNRVTAVLNTMKAVDAHGSFQADDEVGSIFDQLKALVSALDVFLDEEVLDDNS